MNKYLKYINELTERKNWKIYDSGKKLVIHYDFFDPKPIGYILDKHNIPHKTNVWMTTIKVTDVISNMREEKINKILNI